MPVIRSSGSPSRPGGRSPGSRRARGRGAETSARAPLQVRAGLSRERRARRPRAPVARLRRARLAVAGPRRGSAPAPGPRRSARVSSNPPSPRRASKGARPRPGMLAPRNRDTSRIDVTENQQLHAAHVSRTIPTVFEWRECSDPGAGLSTRPAHPSIRTRQARRRRANR
jgi:hypothetical protein